MVILSKCQLSNQIIRSKILFAKCKIIKDLSLYENQKNFTFIKPHKEKNIVTVKTGFSKNLHRLGGSIWYTNMLYRLRVFYGIGIF